ncbi:putative alpha amylase [Echria macrotheca]|uniref:Alpha amylase n=1 Tax=Echria macrotheca TaxID=438768 RepID=A0AAJ0BGK2_9PEZI|nr:putative alpha amylase [Echria macrotheca]
MYPVDLLNLRHEHFVLWVPGSGPSFTPPELVIGTLDQQTTTFSQLGQFPLTPWEGKTDLWHLDANSISPPLSNNAIYHYWFQVGDTSPEKRPGPILFTDPLTFTVDYRVTRGPSDAAQPAAVIKFRDGKLWACDINGSDSARAVVPDQAALPSNNHIVIYELPVSWAKSGNDSRGVDVDVGTFKDVIALFDEAQPGKNFATVAAVRDEAILSDLGINALELMPVADARAKGEWGYATAHYFATDYDLGSSSDLVRLVDEIHSQNIRLFTDVVMAFGHDSYRYIDFHPFHIRPTMEPDNADSYQSHANHQIRDGFGGESWRYIPTVQSYDPESGKDNVQVHPSWAFHRSHLARWMTDFGVGGLRLDSVNNIGNYDFVRSYKERAWELYNARYGKSADPSKFLVIGEELSMPVSMVRQGVLNALWNEPWQARLRAAVLGNPLSDQESFEWNIRKLANTTLDDRGDTNFTDGAQAINYITSHDIEGWQGQKERLYNFLKRNNIWDVEQRAKLAFALLLTSVGIPMIFAGEEFADQMDRSVDLSKKQSDPVNYERKNEGWRRDLFNYVANLVKFRTKCPALGDDDTDFIHVDTSRGGKIMAWSRGGQDVLPVVVVANFSDEDTPGSEYVVSNWPGRNEPGWREVSQGRDVPSEWVGREPLLQWEAKIYTRWRE